MRAFMLLLTTACTGQDKLDKIFFLNIIINCDISHRLRAIKCMHGINGYIAAASFSCAPFTDFANILFCDFKKM